MLPYIGTYLHKEIDPYTKEESRYMANEDVNLLGLCCESDELGMFSSESLQDCIEFKWDKYGQNWHFIGFFLHLCYIIILIMYTDFVYIKKAEDVEFTPAVESSLPADDQAIIDAVTAAASNVAVAAALGDIAALTAATAASATAAAAASASVAAGDFVNAIIPAVEPTVVVEHDDDNLEKYSYILLAGIIYPLVYETV